MGSEAKQCAGTRRDGQRCTAPVMGAGSHCFAHDPERAADRDAARRKGGRNSSRVARIHGLLPPRLMPLFDQLEQALADVLSGELDPRQATAAAAVGRAMVAVLTSGELEDRLRKIEQERGHAS